MYEITKSPIALQIALQLLPLVHSPPPGNRESTPPKCLPTGSASTPPRSRVCVRTASSEALAAFLRRAGRGRYAHP
jgi:hypothetical protein